jgi:hypothetical protein
VPRRLSQPPIISIGRSTARLRFLQSSIIYSGEVQPCTLQVALKRIKAHVIGKDGVSDLRLGFCDSPVWNWVPDHMRIKIAGVCGENLPLFSAGLSTVEAHRQSNLWGRVVL